METYFQLRFLQTRLDDVGLHSWLCVLPKWLAWLTCFHVSIGLQCVLVSMIFVFMLVVRQVITDVHFLYPCCFLIGLVLVMGTVSVPHS